MPVNGLHRGNNGAAAPRPAASGEGNARCFDFLGMSVGPRGERLEMSTELGCARRQRVLSFQAELLRIVPLDQAVPFQITQHCRQDFSRYAEVLVQAGEVRRGEAQSMQDPHRPSVPKELQHEMDSLVLEFAGSICPRSDVLAVRERASHRVNLARAARLVQHDSVPGFNCRHR